MDETPLTPPRIYAVGVAEALAHGWRLTVDNLKTLWVAGLIAYVAQGYLGLAGAAPYIGALISLLVSVFVQPALTAGLVYTIRRRAEGRGVRLEDLFEGFRQRYWESVVTALPPLAVGVAFGAVIVGALVVEAIAFGVFAGSVTWDPQAIVLAVAIVLGTLLPLVLLLAVATMFFALSPVAVWDHPGSGWEAAKESARLVRAHAGSMLLFQVTFAFVWIGALCAGVLSCCVGLVLTIPFAMVWYHGALVCLYRSWKADALSPSLRSPGSPPPALP